MIGAMVHLPPAYRLFAELNVEHLKELQRFAEVGRASAGLIHDMSSPLTAAILHLEQGSTAGLPCIRRARQSIKVLERYIEAARQQLHQQDSNVVFGVEHEAGQARQILRPLARRQQAVVRFDIRSPGCNLFGSPVKFQRILINLALNAMDAYDAVADKEKVVRVTITEVADGLLIVVHDKGRGIADDELPHLFKPFYTTKPHGNPGGIGLAAVKQYVEEDFGGRINIASCQVSGTKFRVQLPMHDK